MCHSIVEVKSTMGQGDFFLEYPKLHELAASENPFVRKLHDFVVRLNPSRTAALFLKPFMRADTAEFCSSCHKVHLDVPVNHYRWISRLQRIRQLAGQRRFGPRRACVLLSEGADELRGLPHAAGCLRAMTGNIKGLVHSHRFPGANGVPIANQDSSIRIRQKFLQGQAMRMHQSFDVAVIARKAPAACGNPRNSSAPSDNRTHARLGPKRRWPASCRIR